MIVYKNGNWRLASVKFEANWKRSTKTRGTQTFVLCVVKLLGRTYQFPLPWTRRPFGGIIPLVQRLLSRRGK